MGKISKLLKSAKPLSSRQKTFRNFANLESGMYFSSAPTLGDLKEFRGMRLSSDEYDNSFVMGSFLGHDYIVVDRHSSERKTIVIEVDLHTLYPFNHFIVYKNDLPPDYFKIIKRIHLHHRPAPVAESELGISRAFSQGYTILSRPEHFARSIFFMHDAPSKTLLDLKGSMMLEVSDRSMFIYDYSQQEPSEHYLRVFARSACTVANLLESRIK